MLSEAVCYNEKRKDGEAKMSEYGYGNLLDGFKTISLVTGVPTLSITKNGFGFNKTCVTKMNYCKFVRLMVDENGLRLAIQECPKDDQQSITFFNQQKNLNVRWNNSDLLKRMERLMGWDFESDGYKCDGEYFEADRVMIFDLKKAQPIL